MITFNVMTEEVRQIYLLSLCELIVNKISKCNGYDIVEKALEQCWEWITSKGVEADELYYYLENLDERDVMTYMQFDTNLDNEPVWICVANALAYIIRDAYHYEGRVYLPETIECVDDETVESFFDNFSKVSMDRTVVDKLLDYIENNPQSVDILKIKQFVRDKFNIKQYKY